MLSFYRNTQLFVWLLIWSIFDFWSSVWRRVLMNFVPWGFIFVELMRSDSANSDLCALLPVNRCNLKSQAEGRCISLCPSGMLFTDLSCFRWRNREWSGNDWGMRSFVVLHITDVASGCSSAELWTQGHLFLELNSLHWHSTHERELFSWENMCLIAEARAGKPGQWALLCKQLGFPMFRDEELFQFSPRKGWWGSGLACACTASLKYQIAKTRTFLRGA